MKIKHFLFIPLLLICMGFCTGCSSMFLREGALIVDNSQTNDTVKVTSLVEPGNGILEDVNATGDAMLVFSNSQAPPITYNIEIYQKNKYGQWSAINFLNSEKPHVSGVFSSKNDGIFYTESTKTNNSSEENTQLMWMSLDRKTTRVLSEENESIITNLYRISDGKIMCVNDKHEVIIIDNAGNRITRNINADYTIQDLTYNEESHQLYFTGYLDESKQLNLYAADINDNDLDPELIDINILSFDFNIINNQLLYRKKVSSENQLILFNCKNSQKKIMTNIVMNQAVLNDDATAIYYSVPIDQNNSRLQIIQKMDIKTKECRQVTSPRSLSSLLYCRKNSLFSSIVDENANSDSLYDSKIFVLTFE